MSENPSSTQNSNSDHHIQQPLTFKGQKTRQKLLQAAEEVFGTKGFFNASIVDITQRAEVSQGTFYNYFLSKNAIFEELVRQLSSNFRNEIRMEIAKAKNSEEVQTIGFQTFFKWVQSHRNLYSIVQQAILVDQELYRWYYERIATGYIKGLKEAMSKGEFKNLDPETVAYSLMGISHFIGMKWVYFREEEVPEPVFNDMVTMMFTGVSK